MPANGAAEADDGRPAARNLSNVLVPSPIKAAKPRRPSRTVFDLSFRGRAGVEAGGVSFSILLGVTQLMGFVQYSALENCG